MRFNWMRIVFAMLLVLAGSHVMASGSLAIDSLQGEKYGFSFNHPSSDLADQRAMRECGADCGVVMRFQSECAAYAADQAKGSNAYGWGTGVSNSIVQQRALSECRTKGGSSCKVRAWGCDAVKPSAQQAASPIAKPNSPTNPTNPANHEFAMQGEWTVDYVSPTGYTANGILHVSEKLGNGIFRGVLVLSFTNGGEAKRVQQDALLSVRGDTVTLNGSNAVYLLGAGLYNVDNYALTVAGNNVLRGTNRDAKGIGGVVVVSRK